MARKAPNCKFDTVTIREAVARLREEGIPIAENRLRCLVKQGKINSFTNGRTIMLFYPSVVEYIAGGKPVKPAPKVSPYIQVLIDLCSTNLNDGGVAKLIDYAMDLTEMPKYHKGDKTEESITRLSPLMQRSV